MRVPRRLPMMRKRRRPVTHEAVDEKLDDLDARLSRTVSDVADTLEQRAVLIQRQRDLQRRRRDGGATATG